MLGRNVKLYLVSYKDQELIIFYIHALIYKKVIENKFSMVTIVQLWVKNRFRAKWLEKERAGRRVMY